MKFLLILLFLNILPLKAEAFSPLPDYDLELEQILRWYPSDIYNQSSLRIQNIWPTTLPVVGKAGESASPISKPKKGPKVSDNRQK